MVFTEVVEEGVSFSSQQGCYTDDTYVHVHVCNMYICAHIHISIRGYREDFCISDSFA